MTQFLSGAWRVIHWQTVERRCRSNPAASRRTPLESDIRPVSVAIADEDVVKQCRGCLLLRGRYVDFASVISK